MANAFADLPSGLWEDGSTVTGVDLRRGSAFQTTGGFTALGARGGVRPSRGDPLGVSLPGAMFVRIQPGVVAIQAPSTEGVYVVTVPTVTDLIVTPAHATQARIDTIGIEVVPGSPDTWRVRMLDGAPSAGTPTAPGYTVPGGMFFRLADIRVNAAATVPTSLTDSRVYTAAAGGVVQIPGLFDLSKVSRDAINDLLPVGTPVYDDTNQQLAIVNNSRRLMPIGIGGDTIRSTSGFLNGSAFNLNNQAFAQFNVENWSFTAPKSGWGYVGFDADVQGKTNSWVLAQSLIRINGAQIADGNDNLMYEVGAGATSRVWRRFRSDVPIWFDQGTTYLFTLDVACFGFGTGTGSAPGTWTINILQWNVTQP